MCTEIPKLLSAVTRQAGLDRRGHTRTASGPVQMPSEWWLAGLGRFNFRIVRH